jgi:hypothetical protein
MQAEMIATAYGKVQIDWLHDLTAEIGLRAKISPGVFPMTA